jgi:hypothetical protein
MARERVAMVLFHGRTPRDEQAREDLVAALPPNAEVGEPDEIGVFEIAIDASDREDALTQVWNGVAAAGADDHVLFLEHPDLPEHWRTRSGTPRA